MERPPVYGIEVFLTIVQEGSMRAAARALGVGAPAVSLQLKALEEKMGVSLIFAQRAASNSPMQVECCSIRRHRPIEIWSMRLKKPEILENRLQERFD